MGLILTTAAVAGLLVVALLVMSSMSHTRMCDGCGVDHIDPYRAILPTGPASAIAVCPRCEQALDDVSSLLYPTGGPA